MTASLSTLVLSIASSAVTALGLEKNPQTGIVEKDLEMARFNIDLLTLLQEKTKNNLTPDEDKFLSTVVNDLKLKFVTFGGPT